MDKKKTGKQGEEYAKKYLESKDYDIIQQNWGCTFGEVDIVARDDKALVFVEVRTRYGSTETALESITPRKRNRMIKSAYAYIHAQNLPDDTLWRIDVLAVSLAPDNIQIEHVEDALDW